MKSSVCGHFKKTNAQQKQSYNLYSPAGQSWKSGWNVCELPDTPGEAGFLIDATAEKITLACVPSPWPNILLSESLLIPKRDVGKTDDQTAS